MEPGHSIEYITERRESPSNFTTSAKKLKKDAKRDGAFPVDAVPAHHYDLGDSVFVKVTKFRGEIYVHIRRYVEYGNKLYPSRDGVVLIDWDYDIMHRCVETVQRFLSYGLGVHECSSDDRVSVKLNATPKTITVEKENFYTKNKCSVTLSEGQWRALVQCHIDVLGSMVHQKFHDMDFYELYLAGDATPTPINNSNLTDGQVSVLMKTVIDFFCDTIFKNIYGSDDSGVSVEDTGKITLEDFYSAILVICLDDFVFNLSRHEILNNDENEIVDFSDDLVMSNILDVFFLKSIDLNVLVEKAKERFNRSPLLLELSTY